MGRGEPRGIGHRPDPGCLRRSGFLGAGCLRAPRALGASEFGHQLVPYNHPEPLLFLIVFADGQVRLGAVASCRAAAESIGRRRF